jgi:hypothetical protein
MLKRISSLILVLGIGGSVLAGTARLHDEHVCKGMESMPGMETAAFCKNEAQSVATESGSQGRCCVTIPQDNGSSGPTINPPPLSFGDLVIHPAKVQSLLFALKPYEFSSATEVFFPNLQASNIRNLPLLI